MVVAKGKSKIASSTAKSTSKKKSKKSDVKSNIDSKKKEVKKSEIKKGTKIVAKAVTKRETSKNTSKIVKAKTNKKTNVATVPQKKSKNSVSSLNKKTKSKRNVTRKVKKPTVKNKNLNLDLDVSDLETGTSMHSRLDKLAENERKIGANLEKMDESLGLPPLPANVENSASEIVNKINDFDSKFHPKEPIKESIDAHKKGFFEKLLGSDKKASKRKKDSIDSLKNSSSSGSINSEKLKDPIDFNYKVDFSKNDFSAQKDDFDSLTPEEKREFKQEEKELEKMEALIENDSKKIEENESSKNGSKDVNPFEDAFDNKNGNHKESNYNNDITNDSSRIDSKHPLGEPKNPMKPNQVPQEFLKEEPHKREVGLKLNLADDSKKNSKKGGRDEKKVKESDKTQNSDKSKDLNASETLLPPADSSFKISTDKQNKKGFFAKLFASKKTKQVDEKQSNRANGNGIIKSSIQQAGNNTDENISDAVKSEDVKIVGSSENISNLGDNSVDGSKLIAPPIDSSSGQSNEDNGKTIEGKEKDDKDLTTDSGISLEPKSSFDEHSTSFLSDSLAAEMTTRGGFEEDNSAKENVNQSKDEGSDKNFDSSASDKKSPDSSDISKKERLSKVDVSRLEAKKEMLESQISELENKHKEMKASFEDRTVKLDRKEKSLDKRERDLDDRENILLTLQTDLIRERKELDKREFEFFMNQEKSSLPGRPKITLSLEDDLKSLPKGMSDERMKLEQMLNQTRTLAINKEFDKAKINYNRLVERFHSLELTPSEKKAVHLSIKELYNDISLLMNTESHNVDNQFVNSDAQTSSDEIPDDISQMSAQMQSQEQTVIDRDVRNDENNIPQAKGVVDNSQEFGYSDSGLDSNDNPFEKALINEKK